MEGDPAGRVAYTHACMSIQTCMCQSERGSQIDSIRFESSHATPRHTTSSHATSRRGMPSHATPTHTKACALRESSQAKSSQVTPRHVPYGSQVKSSHAKPCALRESSQVKSRQGMCLTGVGVGGMAACKSRAHACTLTEPCDREQHAKVEQVPEVARMHAHPQSHVIESSMQK